MVIKAMDYRDIPFWVYGDDAEGQELFEKFETAKTNGEKCFMDRDDYLSLITYSLRILDVSEAEEFILAAQYFYPDDMLIRAYLAYYYAIVGLQTKAEDTLENIETVDVNAMIIIGDIYRIIEKYDKGIEWFDKILETGDDSELKGYAMMGISEMYSELGDYDKSLDYMKHVFEGEGEDIETSDLMVATFVEPNKVNEGIEYFKGYVDDNPYSAIGWMSLGRLYNENNQNEDAIEALDYAIAINDKFAMPYFFKGCVLTDIGEVDEAIKHFNIVMEYDLNEEKNFSVFYNLGRCYVLKGDFKEAMLYFSKAIEAGIPEDENSIYIECARIMTLENEPAEALKYIQKAIDLEPDNISFYMPKAEWYFRRGDIDGAVTVLKYAIEINDTHPLPFIKLSEMYELGEDYHEAMTVLMTALETCIYVIPLLYKLGALVMIHVSDKQGILLIEKAYELEPEGVVETLVMYPEIAKLVKKKLKIK